MCKIKNVTHPAKNISHKSPVETGVLYVCLLKAASHRISVLDDNLLETPQGNRILYSLGVSERILLTTIRLERLKKSSSVLALTICPDWKFKWLQRLSSPVMRSVTFNPRTTMYLNMKGWNSISLIFQLFENQYYWSSNFLKLKTNKDNVLKCVRLETFTNPDNSFNLSDLQTLRIFHQESWLEIVLDKILSLFTQLCVGRLMMIGWENRVTATVCTRKQ